MTVPQPAEADRDTPELLVIIVNYRTADLVVDCLDSLCFPGTLPDKSVVVVADCASQDGSVEVFRQWIDEGNWQIPVLLLPLAINGGFSYGNNRAFEHAVEAYGSPRFVLYLNPDTIVRPNGLRPLLDFLAAHPAAGIAGARMEDPDGTPQSSAFRFPTILAELEAEAKIGPITRLLKHWQIAYPPTDRITKVNWVSGAGLMVKRQVLDEIGMLDERYFLYYEEVDLCKRAARAGWECWHVPQSRIVHLVGRSTGVTRRTAPVRRPTYWFESRRRFFLTHYSRLYAWMADAAWLIGHMIWRLRILVERKTNEGPPNLLYDFLNHALSIRRLGCRRRA
jgi:GT2 family glycosyltransferase